MPISQSVQTLAQWLAGEFENRAQALDQPAWFVHLTLWHRPLPRLIQGHLALFAEQANVLQRDHPYRQRILVLRETEDFQQIQIQYLALRQPEQFRGAGANRDRLANLSEADVEWLPGCILSVAQQNDAFVAEMAPDAQCCFQYEGKTRQVVLGFEARANQFFSYDKGVEPETGKALWGALMGPYTFQKSRDFAAELPLS